MERYCPWEDVAMGLRLTLWENYLWKKGDFPGFKSGMEVPKGWSDSSEPSNTKSFGQMQISKRFMELGDKEEAVRIASNIASDAHKAEAFVEISKVLKQLGKKEESKQAPLFF